MSEFQSEARAAGDTMGAPSADAKHQAEVIAPESEAARPIAALRAYGS